MRTSDKRKKKKVASRAELSEVMTDTSCPRVEPCSNYYHGNSIGQGLNEINS